MAERPDRADRPHQPHRESAFAKVNLCLFMGPTRSDGRHELVTLFESVSLADELVITASGDGEGEGDEVVCAGLEGPNIVAQALEALRAAGWPAPPVRVEIDKRIPVAAGLGGGSADAAALLRHAPRLAPVSDRVRREIAIALGADVPSQLEPGPSLGTGAGELLEPVAIEAHALVVVPQPFSLRTPDVYREADRLGLQRTAGELSELGDELRTALAGTQPLPEHLLVNDLQAAAISLASEIADAVELARGAGAAPAIVCGSGPTVVGVFRGSQAPDHAAAAARELRGRYPGAMAVSPVGRGTERGAPND
jgi:4-diphosphocytidyl-2-C-methyl-D-erythritol kinase